MPDRGQHVGSILTLFNRHKGSGLAHRLIGKGVVNAMFRKRSGEEMLVAQYHGELSQVERRT